MQSAPNGIFGGYQGHYSLQTASEVKSDLRLEIIDHDNIGNTTEQLPRFVSTLRLAEERKPEKPRWTMRPVLLATRTKGGEARTFSSVLTKYCPSLTQSMMRPKLAPMCRNRMRSSSRSFGKVNE